MTISIQEARTTLVDYYIEKENFLSDLKDRVNRVLADLPDDVPDAKVTALKAVAEKEAKKKLKKLKDESAAILELMDELAVADAAEDDEE